MATVDEVTGNVPEVAETAIIHTLQLLERVCTRNEAVVQGTMTQQASMTQARRETRDEAKRVIWTTRSNGTMENGVVHDESILCSSCHKTVRHPERVVG